MKENFENMEQPLTTNVDSQGKEILQIENGAEPTETEKFKGSILNKFKDVSALEDAYNSLQSDYTKKCQLLASIQKKNSDNEEENNKTTLPEIDAVKNWQERVKSFFDSTPNAREYQDEIAKIIFEDKEISASQNPLEKAWQKFSAKNFFSKRELASDPEFLQNYVFCNEKIKAKIIEDYFKTLDFKPTPTLIGGDKKSGKVLVTPPNKPKTLKDATKLVEDMFD